MYDGKSGALEFEFLELDSRFSEWSWSHRSVAMVSFLVHLVREAADCAWRTGWLCNGPGNT